VLRSTLCLGKPERITDNDEWAERRVIGLLKAEKRKQFSSRRNKLAWKVDARLKLSSDPI
jgi:hypothetical protein